MPPEGSSSVGPTLVGCPLRFYLLLLHLNSAGLGGEILWMYVLVSLFYDPTHPDGQRLNLAPPPLSHRQAFLHVHAF